MIRIDLSKRYIPVGFQVRATAKHRGSYAKWEWTEFYINLFYIFDYYY
jgi:hypothetical protein